MKLIIDIPEDDYELVLKYIYPQRVFYELVHGTPIPDNATVCDIEQIRAEIKELATFENVDVLVDVMKIIDKYTK